MNRVTIDDICNMNICYSEERVRRLAGDATDCTALDVLKRKDIPLADRLFLVLREEFIPATTLHEFACRCAERALSCVGNPDPRSRAAIAVKRAWVRGEATDDELAAAGDAAGAAAWAAAWAAAGDAAWDAAGAAAWAAAWDARAAAWAAARDAAWAAAWDAARDAAWAAAGDAERKWQVKELVRMLKEAETQSAGEIPSKMPKSDGEF